MPLKSREDFIPAPTRSSALWRYMNLPKFLSLIQTNTLHFSNLELMAQADPFEGTLPSSRFEHRKWASLDEVPEGIREKLPGYLPRGVTDLRVAFRKFIESANHRIRLTYAYRRSVFISCWHLNDFESSAMWDIYSRRNEGIAIVSSEERIDAALAACPESIYGGRVSYEDYSDDEFIMDDGSVFAPVFYKRRSFEYESEYRLVHWDAAMTRKQIRAKNGYIEWQGQMLPDIGGMGVQAVPMEPEELEQIPPRPSHYASCDINILIDKIFISPTATDWFVDVVKSACDAYGLNITPTRSELMASPMR